MAKNVEEELKKLEAIRQQLTEEPIEVEAKIRDEESNEEKPLIVCAFQAALTSKGPTVVFEGDLVAARGLVEYMIQYLNIVMQQHIIESQNKGDKK
jgi:L-2-hydroxyglutarate oxidase LhgO